MDGTPRTCKAELRKLRRQLDEPLSKLAGDEARVLKFRYGLEIGRLMAFDEVAAVIGKSSEEVKELAASGLRSLRQVLREPKG